MRNILILILLLLLQTLGAERMTGAVFDEYEMPLSEVLIKGNIATSISGADGRYVIAVSEDDSLLFHKLGYDDRVIKWVYLNAIIVMKRMPVTISGYSIREKMPAQMDKLELYTIDIEQEASAQSLSEIITGNSGLMSSGTRIAGSQQTLAIPGFDARHTLVMLDGIPLNAAGEDFDLSMIPLSMVSEIEVISGNLTQLAGSGSMGAIINIKSRQIREDFYYEVSQETGSYDYTKIELLLAISRGNISFHTSAAYQQAENDFEYEIPSYWGFSSDTQRRENNSFSQLDLVATMKFDCKQHQLEYKIFYTDLFRMLPGAVNNPELFHKARLTGDVWHHQLHWSWQSQRVKFFLDSWYDSENNIYDNTRLEEPYNNYMIYNTYAKNKQEIRGCRPQFKWQPIDWLDIDLGSEYRYENYSYQDTTLAQNSISEKERDSFAGFAATEIRYDKSGWQLWFNGNLRSDLSADFDAQSSFSLLSGVRTLNENKIELSMAYSEGFTSPSFYNLYWQGSSEAVGNPDLLPEKNKSMQLHAKYETGNFSFGLNWRKDNLTDMVIWIQTFTKAWKPVNIAAAEVENLEFNFRVELPWQLSIGGLWNITYTTDETRLENGESSAFYGKELTYTPDHKGNIQISWEPGDFTVSLDGEYIGTQWTTRDQLTAEKELAAYQLQNMFISWDLYFSKCCLTPSLKINNLMDKFYQTYDYVPQPGRNFVLAVKLSPIKNIK